MARSITSAVALDLGTTSIKAALADQNGKLHNIFVQPAPKISIDSGRYESDALQYALTAEQVLAKCLTQAGKGISLGLCSQRSSFLVWESATGQPVTPLISWQDDRGLACCQAVQSSENIIRNLTGLRLTPYYFAPKLSVLLQTNPEWRHRLENGALLVGTLDSFLIWRWTSGRCHVIDASMAARTLLMDIKQLLWSPVLCELFNIPCAVLPQIKPSAGLNITLDNGLTLQASLADQSAALIASIDENRAEALVNLGTGGFVMRYQVTEKNILDGYLQTLVYVDNNSYSHLANEGTLNSISAALAPYSADQCNVNDLAANNIYCLAEPSGIGAPYFRNDLGVCFSQSIDHLNGKQIVALLLEAIIFRVARILEEFHRVTPITQVYLSGGLSALPCLQQGIAQCVPYKVSRLQQQETSLQGAAMLATRLRIERYRALEEITIANRNNTLYGKYQRWKNWLDGLLIN